MGDTLPMLGASGKPRAGAGTEGGWSRALGLGHRGLGAGENEVGGLRQSESVFVPLGQVLGRKKYHGRVLLPVPLRWFNPTLDEEGIASGPRITPWDQRISRGLSVSVGVR